ncbi:MAG: hypothetical protein NVS3B14_10150 [Ktedonobacteraceae bacterium]
MNGLIEWVIFIALSAVVLIMAASMILTMSMYRAGLALMASFVALAGLFILLDADLIAAIQIMMNVGGMLVMVLFMVMMMMDPGGEMMWSMKRDMHIPGPGAFSMHMPRGEPPEDEPTTKKTAQPTDWTCPMHPEVSSLDPDTCPTCGMTLIPRAKTDNGLDDRDSTAQASIYTCPMHPEVREHAPGPCPKCGMTLLPVNDTAQYDAANEQQGMEMEAVHADAMAIPHEMKQMDGDSGHTMAMEMHDDGMGTMDMSEHDMSNMDTNMSGLDMSTSSSDMDMSSGDMNMSGMTPRQNYQMMVDMAMSTAQLPWAIALGIASALLLIVLILQTPWPLAAGGPTQDATTAVGELLLSRYMIGFEGAAFLILAGIAGAVLFARRERSTTGQQREQKDRQNTVETNASEKTEAEQ